MSLKCLLNIFVVSPVVANTLSTLREDSSVNGLTRCHLDVCILVVDCTLSHVYKARGCVSSRFLLTYSSSRVLVRSNTAIKVSTVETFRRKRRTAQVACHVRQTVGRSIDRSLTGLMRERMRNNERGRDVRTTLSPASVPPCSLAS